MRARGRFRIARTLIFQNYPCIYAAYFENMADYDGKKVAGLACPSCGGAEISKAIMAPRVGKAKADPAPMHPCNPTGCANAMCPMAQVA